MNKIAAKGFSVPQLSEKAFRRLGRFIQSEAGIKMPPAKKTMLQSRLQKRLRHLEMTSFDDYCDFAFGPEGSEELIRMVDIVTTNKTDFFRESAHFDFLTQTVLPELIHTREADIRKRLFVWSAGCASGEEPYTLAMVLAEFAESVPEFRFGVLATDISTNVLDRAKLAIYPELKVDPVPMPLKKKYLLKSKDRSNKLVRIIPQLRAYVQFSRLNLMDDDFGIREPIDIIFCRNVIIYFNKEIQQAVLSKFWKHLIPGGYLFLGHSETLNGLDVSFSSVAPTVYRKAV